jgi:hypothetical protein
MCLGWIPSIASPTVSDNDNVHGLLNCSEYGFKELATIGFSGAIE